MALDAKELARITKEELSKLGEIASIDDASDETQLAVGDAGLAVTTIDGHNIFITFEPF